MTNEPFQAPLTGYADFKKAMQENHLEAFIFSTFEKAKESRFPHSLVVIPDADSNFFDVYLTSCQNEDFGEYACWSSEEFEEELAFYEVSPLLQTVTKFIVDMYTSENQTERMRVLNPNLRFTSYETQ